MRTKQTETKELTKIEEVVVSESATCNKCGQEFLKDEDDYCWDAQVHNFGVSGGYGSEYDMESFSFDLCEGCVNELVRSFKFVPDNFKMGDFTYPKEEDHQKVFDNWKMTGKWETLMYCSYEELVELNGYLHTDGLNSAIEKYHPGKPLLDEPESIKRLKRYTEMLKKNKEH